MTGLLRIEAAIPAPPAEVHRALTDPAALRNWLAEEVDVALPERWGFAGRHSPGGTQQLEHLDEHSLRFRWLLDGVDSTVTITLAPDGDRTVLTLTQTDVPEWPAILADESAPRNVLYTFWALAMSNLADHVAGREPTPRADFATAEQRARVRIAASPARVFDSLVDPAQFSSWFGTALSIEPRVGGRWSMGPEGATAPARITAYEPGRLLSVDWGDMVESWELSGSDGGTRLTFVHSGFDEDHPPYAGWLGGLAGVGELRRYHELADWAPVWREVEAPGLPDGMLTI